MNLKEFSACYVFQHKVYVDKCVDVHYNSIVLEQLFHGRFEPT